MKAENSRLSEPVNLCPSLSLSLFSLVLSFYLCLSPVAIDTDLKYLGYERAIQSELIRLGLTEQFFFLTRSAILVVQTEGTEQRTDWHDTRNETRTDHRNDPRADAQADAWTDVRTYSRTDGLKNVVIYEFDESKMKSSIIDFHDVKTIHENLKIMMTCIRPFVSLSFFNILFSVSFGWLMNWFTRKRDRERKRARRCFQSR